MSGRQKVFFLSPTRLLLGFGLSLLSACSVQIGPGADYQSQAGVFDLRSLDPRREAVTLDGLWLWTPDQFPDPGQALGAGSAWPVLVPDIWNGYTREGQTFQDLGAATYQIRLAPPGRPGPYALKINTLGSAFRLFANGQLLAEAGQVSLSPEGARPGYAPQVVPLPESPEGWLITVHISNWHHKEGGIWYSWLFGGLQELTAIRQNLLLLDLFLFGALLIMGVYNLGLFGFLHRDKSPLYFGLLCLFLGFRTLLYGEYFILIPWPSLDWELLQKLGYATLLGGPPLFYHFIRSLFPKDMPGLPVRLVDISAGVFMLAVLVTPYYVYSQILAVFQIWLLSAAAYMLGILILALWRHRLGAGLFLSGFLLLFVAMVNDVLHTSLIIRTTHLVPLGIFVFIVCQSFVLTKKHGRAFIEVEKLSNSLLDTNKSLNRFVPTEFLRYLGRESITQIQLGDHEQHRMTVLFSDIRSFTKLSERMSPEETFRFLNSYLKRVSPSLLEHRGFIDKYLGDGLMALFPEEPDDAVQAALAMLQALQRYNRHRRRSGYAPLRIGIGIHSGDLMMGTIGNQARMDGTVISDAVNLASRLEGLNKVYGAGILLSEATILSLKDPTRYGRRFLGALPIKGKADPVPVFEIFDGDSPALKAAKRRTRWAFEAAVESVIDGDLAGAEIRFQALVAEVPQDRAARAYLRRLRRKQTELNGR